MCVFQDRSGNLWVGTWGGGLNRLNKTRTSFNSYGKKDGLPNDVVQGILEDDSGFIWLSTNNGISRFNPKTEQFRNFDEGDGIQSKEFNSNSAFKDSKGRLYFGGINSGLNEE